MSVLHLGLPRVDSVLAQLGGVLCLRWQASERSALLREAFGYLDEEGVADTVALTADRLLEGDVAKLNESVPDSWQEAVTREVEALHETFPDNRTDGFRPWWASSPFSQAETPQPKDLHHLLNVIKQIQGALQLAHRSSDSLLPLIALYQQLDQHGSPKQPALVLHDSPPSPRGGVPVYTVGEFKGLEADGVVLLDREPRQFSRTELFVAASRARSHLVLILREDTFRRYNILDALGGWKPTRRRATGGAPTALGQ